MIIGFDKMNIMRVSCMLFLMFLVACNSVRADISQDKKECEDQLLGLTPCLPYVDGEEKAPSSTCCIHLIQHFNESFKCLCTLIRDRDDPQLGFNINATLALKLPFICNIPVNATQCLDSLHLDPKSPEAQVFEQFSDASASGSSSATTSTTGLSRGSSSESMHEKRWLRYGMAGGVSIWLLMSSFICRL